MSDDNKCSTCKGEGGWFENHGPGLSEPMGCPDCLSTGFERPWEEMDLLRAQLATALSAIDEWKKLAQDAIEEFEDARGYANEYFTEKWGYDEKSKEFAERLSALLKAKGE